MRRVASFTRHISKLPTLVTYRLGERRRRCLRRDADPCEECGWASPSLSALARSKASTVRHGRAKGAVDGRGWRSAAAALEWYTTLLWLDGDRDRDLDC